MKSSLAVTEVKPNSICALKGSSVNLTCSHPRSASDKKWLIVYMNGTNYIYNELPADGNDGKYRISEDSFYSLTISDLTEKDGKYYCCCEKTVEQRVYCIKNSIWLQVADLQVKVFPASEGQKVTLMCTTSCALTESPAAFIWYQNTEVLYEDWSPWYQELVSSENSVRYSCAVKGYLELRASEVSVDSVTSTCFSLTYSGGRICSNHQTEKRSCSVTFPREIHVERTNTDNHVRLSCETSCPLTDTLKSFKLYKNRKSDRQKEKQQIVVPNTTPDSFFCSVKDLEDLFSAEVCADRTNCWSVNYVSRRICALKGSSVNISSKYSHPEYQQLKEKRWYKAKINAGQEGERLTEVKDKVQFQDLKNQHILRLNNLQVKDSAEYRWEVKTDDHHLIQPGFPGVTLIVTDLRVDVGPAAEVTEAQRVTLTCRTSCPLPENTSYIWFFNSQPLNLTIGQNKQLILDAVSSQDAGNYSCAVRTDGLIRSAGTTLTVRSSTGTWKPAAAVVSAALLHFIPLIVFLLRKYKTSSQSSSIETADNPEQLNSAPTHGEVSAQPAEEELPYSQLFQNDPVPLCSTVEPHQHQEQEQSYYSQVKIRTETTPE
ncbi:uncharacterized protein LOC112450206 [Kryptolebias marmoratus]|uniref:uncharacterized protein LOC112450206 n=1 Tax=Kryptolebias marmoratus TaxID=37003 RepID=UPI0018ACB7EE|nr:uncharacterized protein LOC112450206 [Kryptolebias marmoratus]